MRQSNRIPSQTLQRNKTETERAKVITEADCGQELRKGKTRQETSNQSNRRRHFAARQATMRRRF